GTQIVAYQQPGFEASFDVRMSFIGNEFEMFYEDGPGGEAPLSRRSEADLFIRSVRRAMVGYGQPAGLYRAIGPKRDVNCIRDEAISGVQVGRIAEGAGLGEQCWQRIGVGGRHIEEGRDGRAPG